MFDVRSPGKDFKVTVLTYENFDQIPKTPRPKEAKLNPFSEF